MKKLALRWVMCENNVAPTEKYLPTAELGKCRNFLVYCSPEIVSWL